MFPKRRVRPSANLPYGTERPSTKKEAPARARASRRSGQCRDVRPDRCSQKLLHRLPVQSEIEAVALDFFADPQADDQVDDFQDDQGHDHVVDEHGADADALVEHLAGIALDQARRAAVSRDGEHAGRMAPDAPPTAWTPNASSASS